MTRDQIRAAVKRALEDMTCGCYDAPTMEYRPDGYPCPKCGLAEVAAQLDRPAEVNA